MPVLSVDLTSILIGGVVLLCLLLWRSTRRTHGLPPGPGPALPVLGHLYLLAEDPQPQYREWKRQYGDVFSLYMGRKVVVMLTSYSAIREALVTFTDAFNGRPEIFTVDRVFRKLGIAGSSGSRWKEQRKASLEILRDMGMGKTKMAEKIQEELHHYIQAIRDHQGEPMDLFRMTQVSVSNIICSIMLGKRFDYDDPEFLNYLYCVYEIFKLSSGSSYLNYLPLAGYIPGDPFQKKNVLGYVDAVDAFINKHLVEHRKVMEEGDVGHSDFIYSYLHLIRDRQARGIDDTTLDEPSLLNTLVDLFSGGSDTTSNALNWALLYFLHYPHVQDKCFKEVSDVIGLNRLPNIRDKPNMTYMDAMVQEILRKEAIVPLPAPRTAAYDVRFRGFLIPKDAVVLPNVSCIMQDPDVWGDPENFRPERFIGPDGKLTRPEEHIPFGIGRRVCLGEAMSRMELFLYLATLVQQFHFVPAEEGNLPTMEGVFGISVSPQHYKIRAVPRM